MDEEVLNTLRELVPELKMDFADFPALLLIVHSVINNASSQTRGNLAPVTAFIRLDAQIPISTLIRTVDSKTRYYYRRNYGTRCQPGGTPEDGSIFHPVVQTSVRSNRERIRECISKETMPKFDEGYYLLMSREDLYAGGKLALRWSGPRRVLKTLSDYLFEVQDLRTGSSEEAHGTRWSSTVMTPWIHKPSFHTYYLPRQPCLFRGWWW